MAGRDVTLFLITPGLDVETVTVKAPSELSDEEVCRIHTPLIHACYPGKYQAVQPVPRWPNGQPRLQLDEGGENWTATSS